MIGTSEQYPHGALWYAHSDDGFTWHRPELDLFPYGDHRKTNIVYPNRLEGSVFRDPRDGDFKLVTMESRWRYGDQVLSGDAEALPLRTRLREQGMPDRELRELLRLTGELRGASSPDGIHWTRLDATLMDRFCDTQNVALYDEERRRYVAYVRMSRGFRRAVGRSESPEFATEWPAPQVVLEADPQDPPTDDLYTNGYSRYPGGGPFHLMFPAVYYRTRDVLDVHLAVSRDVRPLAPSRTHADHPDGAGGRAGGLRHVRQPRRDPACRRPVGSAVPGDPQPPQRRLRGAGNRTRRGASAGRRGSPTGWWRCRRTPTAS